MMPRPEYASDEKRRKNKPAVRVHHSVETHPKMEAIYPDNDAFATWTRILIEASKAHAGKTGNRLTISKNATCALAGRTSVVRALQLIRTVCATLLWEIHETRTSVTIAIRNFARKQGFDSADGGVIAEHLIRTPHLSESESKSESEKKMDSSLRSESSPAAHTDAPQANPPTVVVTKSLAPKRSPEKIHPEISPTILVVLEDVPRFAALGERRWGNWWQRVEKTFLSHPAISLAAELGKADAWIEAHPGRNRARTPKGAAQFLNHWLDKAMNDACRERAIVDARAARGGPQRALAVVSGNGNGAKAKKSDYDIPPIEGWQPNRGGRA
jgi:hypothetical protein